MTKEYILENIEEGIEALEGYEDFTTTKEFLANISSGLKKNEIYIPVIGDFSAGKSNFLNVFMDRKALVVANKAETSLATELHYTSEDEYIETIGLNGESAIYPLEKMEEINDKANEFKYMKVYINSEEIKKMYPIILVDMPGFDSGYEAHNKAILEYIEKGEYYIALVESTSGNLKEKLISQLMNLIDMNKNFSLVLTKTDLVKPADLEDIKKLVKTTLRTKIGVDKEPFAVNREDRESVLRVVHNIDKDKIFEDRFLSIINDKYYELLDNIDLMKKSLTLSDVDLRKSINKLRESLEEIKHQRDEKITSLKDKYVNYESILSKIGSNINSEVDTLTNIAMESGSEAFSNRISEIVRDTLFCEVEKVIDSYTEEVAFEFSTSLSLDDSGILGTQVTEKLKNTALGYVNSLKKGITSFGTKASSEGIRKYQTIATIFSLTTNFVSPIFEVIGIFLPQILDSLFKKHQEAKQKEQIRNKIINEVIPSLKSSVRPKLKSILLEEVNKVTEQVYNSFEESITEKANILEQAEKERDEKEAYIELKVEELTKLEEKIGKLVEGLKVDQ